MGGNGTSGYQRERHRLDERRRRLSALGHPRIDQTEARAALTSTLREAETAVAALAPRAERDVEGSRIYIPLVAMVALARASRRQVAQDATP